MTGRRSRVGIVDFEPTLAGHFDRLNSEWLDTLFTVEDIDARVLGDPQRYVIAAAGHILFARAAGEIVGAVALKHAGSRRYELTKMAVTATARGMGAGRLLGLAAVDRYRELGGTCLFLESHSSLLPALVLYESLGFRHCLRSAPSEYARADVYMEYVA